MEEREREGTHVARLLLLRPNYVRHTLQTRLIQQMPKNPPSRELEAGGETTRVSKSDIHSVLFVVTKW